MPTYRVTDPNTGLTLRLTGDSPPTEAELEAAFKAQPNQSPAAMGTASDAYQGGAPGSRGVSGGFEPLSATQKVVGKALPYVRPLVEGGAMAAGGFLGAPAGPPGSVGGAALGYGMGKTAMDAAERYAGGQPQPGMAESAGQAAKDVATGAAMEMGGQSVAAGLSSAARSEPGRKVLGKVGDAVASFFGILTNSPPKAIKKAYQVGGASGSQEFNANIKGKMTGEDVAVAAQKTVADYDTAVGKEYNEKLAEVVGDKTQINLAPIKERLDALMSLPEEGRGGFGIRMVADDKGKKMVDYSRSTLTRSSEGKVEELIDIIHNWGKEPGDNTAIRLDTLKRKIGDAIPESESNNARALLQAMYNEVKRAITSAVPAYSQAMAPYEAKMNMIRDLKRALSLSADPKKINPDTVITKIDSALKNDREFRLRLLNELSDMSGQDFTAMAAGRSLRSWAPHGNWGALARGGGLGTAAIYGHPGALALALPMSPHLVGRAAQGLGAMRGMLPAAAPLAGPALSQTDIAPGIEKYLQTKVLTGGEGNQ